MALITDFPSLRATVIDQMDRPDLDSVFPQFVALAESRFNAGLRAREMETAAPVAGTVAAPVTSAPLPASFLEWIDVEWAGSGRTARPTFVEPDSPEARFMHRPGGDPQFFTVLAGQVRVVPAKPGTILLTYYAQIPALTAAAPVNWLISKAPDAYLYAVLGEAYLYQKAPDLSQAHFALAVQAAQALGMKADNAKISRRPARQSEVAASTQARERPE